VCAWLTGQGLGFLRGKVGAHTLPDVSWVPSPLTESGAIAAESTAKFGHVRCAHDVVRGGVPGARRPSPPPYPRTLCTPTPCVESACVTSLHPDHVSLVIAGHS
jgi:hypothetical protein